jgi:YihY family inner membrane protein
MSSTTRVPETRDLDGEDALRTLRRTGPTLFKDAFRRVRWSDGFSHSRALGFQLTLTLLPALVAVQGLATMLGTKAFARVLRDILDRLLPGPTERVVEAAARQGGNAARAGVVALVVGVLGALIAGATTMGQVERAANRIYGIEKDRPGPIKYARATGLAITAGLLAVASFALVVAGKALTSALGVRGILAFARWPFSMALAVVAFAVLFRVAPNRRQPRLSWLAVGAGVAVLLWSLFTLLLSLYVGSARVGATYGALVGVISLLLWAQLSSLALLYGIAVCAQLEAVRGGVTEPVSDDASNRRPTRTRTATAPRAKTGKKPVKPGAARKRARAST